MGEMPRACLGWQVPVHGSCLLPLGGTASAMAAQGALVSGGLGVGLVTCAELSPSVGVGDDRDPPPRRLTGGSAQTAPCSPCP